MKIPNLTFIASIVTGLGMLCSAHADDSTTPMTASRDTDTMNNNGGLYRCQELSFDLFGSLALSRQTIDHISTQRINHNASLGVGGGINYFFTRYVGVGAEAFSDNTTGSFVDSSSGNVFLRYPIGESGIAPYIYGGGGYDFENIRQGFGQAGTGIEFRLCQHLGFFVDARYVFAEHSRDYGVGRAGFRYAF